MDIKKLFEKCNNELKSVVDLVLLLVVGENGSGKSVSGSVFSFHL